MSRQESFLTRIGREIREADEARERKDLIKAATKAHAELANQLLLCHGNNLFEFTEYTQRDIIEQTEKESHAQLTQKESDGINRLTQIDNAYTQSVFLFFFMQLSFEETYARAVIEAEHTQLIDDLSEELQYDFVPSPRGASDTSFANISAANFNSPR